jgi:hypothetical protein
MSRRVKKNYHHLKVLSTSKPNQVKALLKVADDDLIKSVCECVYNVLKSTVPVTLRKKQQLAKHKSPLLTLVNKQVPLSKKRKVLEQKGGNFLSLLLPPVLTVLEHFL